MISLEFRAQYMAPLPGLAERFEPESPGMHFTDTVDYGILMDGELSLELDDGKMVALKHGDIVVQNGTRHLGASWRQGSKLDIRDNRSEAFGSMTVCLHPRREIVRRRCVVTVFHRPLEVGRIA